MIRAAEGRFTIGQQVSNLPHNMLVALLLLFPAPAPAFQQKPGGAEGHVVDAVSGEPIRKAIVILRTGPDGGVAAYTDVQGLFRFENLDPGAYTATASRDGYMADRKAPPTVVTVQPEKTESEITLKLVRTGAISGRVMDADGDPAVQAGVSIEKLSGSVPSGAAITNDRGEYRAFGIAPGKYRVVVTWSSRIAAPSATPVKLASGEEQTYRPTWYPGTPDRKQATVVEVTPGADLQGFDIQLVRSHAVRVRGRVIGLSTPAFVVLRPAEPSARRGGGDAVLQGPPWTFEIGGVLPGDYELEVNGFSANGRGPSASQKITVGESDIEGIELTVGPPQQVTGRLVPPEGRQLSPGWMVFLNRRQGNQGGALGNVGANVAADGTFHLEGVSAGDYTVSAGRFNASDADADTYVSAVRAGDEDIRDKGLHVGDSAPAPISIFLAADGGAIDLSVVDDQGVPVPDTTLMLLPDHPHGDEGFDSGCRTDARGSCTARSIAPGEYHAFAFAKDDRPDAHDTERMKAIEKYGKAVVIAPSGQVQVQLQPVPGEE
jgi:hypothetical protein